ncbi:MAG: glycoside hydrolase family 43 protein [Deltaproteobacteria bacterium]|nr:glycoside hydrolase family 43 protein [Deltaproteobacteria bacterium]
MGMLKGALFLIAVFCGSVAMAAPAYGPVIDLPGAASAADPCLIRVSDTYYLYPTHTGRTVECWSSTDLVNWTYEGVVWGPAPDGAWNDNMVWAPEVFIDGDDYYLYYTANDKIGVAIGDGPTGPFVDVYDEPFLGGDRWEFLGYTIDGHVFRDDDQKLYLYGTGYNPLSILRVWELDDPITPTTQEGTPVLGPEVLGWEFVVLEAPWMIKHDGTYYLMYSGNRADTNAYAIGYATATSPLGPFTKYDGNPILAADTDAGFYGPGHHSVVRTPDERMVMAYHTKIAPTTGWDRLVRLNEIAFNGDGSLCVVLDESCPDLTTDDDAVDDDTDDDDVLDDDTFDDDASDDDAGDDTVDDDLQASDDDDASSGDDDDDDGCGT